MLGRLMGRGGRRPFDLSPGGMRERATRATGLSDFGDDPVWAELLQEISDGLEGNDNLTPYARLTARIFYQGKLVNKLRMVDYLKKSPEVLDRPIEAPIFIVGWYRTGTTALHNLLESAPNHRSFGTWELIEPIPLSPNPWIDRFLRRMRARGIVVPARLTMPDLDPVHPLLLDWPEEEFFLLENDLVGPTLFFMYEGERYAKRMCEIDVKPAYRALRRQLQILSGPNNSQRLVLKAPIHLWNLDALHEAFPDAKFVFTHREPVSALVSACSFCAITTAKAARELDRERIGRFWLDYNELGLQRATEARKAIPADQQIDVPLAAMSANPESTVRRIYERFGIEFSETARQLVRDRAASGQGRAKKKHSYSATDYGLTDAEINERFAAYRVRYAEILNDWGVT